MEGVKGDGSTYHRCLICGGHRKLEIKHDGSVWFCHKCGVGGGLKIARPPGLSHAVPGAGLSPGPGAKNDHPSFSPAPSGGILMKYLERRVPKTRIEELRPHRGPDAFRVYFPLYRDSCANLPVGWCGRDILPGGRYITLGDRTLWGLHRLSGGEPRIVLVEGVFDAFWDRRRLALLGKNLSPLQEKVLKGLEVKEIVVCLDGDARKDTARICRQLAEKFEGAVFASYLPMGCEPDTWGNRPLPMPERVA